ncbi:MAG TPA: hypothetical protein VFU96_10560 [Acidimicrobiia bacterium]|nr:hypothetical protein [Acidimicrobiia bacterium]
MPGVVLGIGFGVGSLLTAYGVIRRPLWGWTSFLEQRTRQHWSWIATVALGVGHVVWIFLELLFLPEMSWFHPLYGAVGLGLARHSVSAFGEGAPSGALAVPSTG